jgi:predicted ArsR family transcriptional regulator
MNSPTIREQVWQALRIANSNLTVHELSMVANASNAAIKLHLYDWQDMGLLKVAQLSRPKRRGRPALTYWLIDKAPVYPPAIKKET